MRKLDKDELDKLKSLVDEVVYSTTKKDAALPLRKLKFYANTLKPELDPYLAEKLSEVVIYADSASGQAHNRQHWQSVLNQCWYVFENGATD